MGGTQKNTQRKRPMITVTLSRDAKDRLDKIATLRHSSRSAEIERMIWRTHASSTKEEGQ